MTALAEEQPTLTSAATPPPSGRIITQPESTSQTLPSTPTAEGTLVKGDPVAIPTEIKAQLQQFQSARDAYLKKQKELAQQLKGSGEEQRKLVREQLQVLRRDWLERSLAFRREVSDRVPPDLRGFGILESKKTSAVDSRRDHRNLK